MEVPYCLKEKADIAQNNKDEKRKVYCKQHF